MPLTLYRPGTAEIALSARPFRGYRRETANLESRGITQEAGSRGLSGRCQIDQNANRFWHLMGDVIGEPLPSMEYEVRLQALSIIAWGCGM